MAQPPFVPVSEKPSRASYSSPPIRRRTNLRQVNIAPSEAVLGTEGFGSPGPDQGYALKLTEHLDDQIFLTGIEKREDILKGCLGIALKRASLLGRAPILDDWRAALTVWGFFDPTPPEELMTLRRELFGGLAGGSGIRHRSVADMVDGEKLARPLVEIRLGYDTSWQFMILSDS